MLSWTGKVQRQISHHHGYSRIIHSDTFIVLALFAVFFALRLPFLSQFPVNWDSVQYMLGIESFDLRSHQPHPPGYIGYIMLGRVFAFIFGGAHLGLVMMSAVAGAIASAMMYPLAKCWLERRYALITAGLFGTSPLVWYYSEVALNYIIEAAVVVPLAWMLYRARRDVSWRDLLIASVLLSVLGAVRQSGLVLMLPLWLYTAWAFPWRQRIKIAATLGSITLAWLAPLLWMSGGIATYWEESQALAALVNGQSSILATLQERATNLIFVLAAVVVSLAVALVIVISYRSMAASTIRNLSTHDRWFFTLWAAPALLTYVVGHMGQFGYILTILPIGFLLVGTLISRLTWEAQQFRYAAPAYLSAFIIIANSLVFAVLPSAGMIAAEVIGGGDQSSPAMHVRQYDIEESDEYWSDLVSSIQRFPEGSTAVLATIGGPRISGAYRHLSYYLEDYQIYGLGVDQHGVFGQFFTTRNGDSNYNVHRLDTAQPVVVLPEEIEYIITPDREIIKQIPDSMSTMEFSDSDIVVMRRPPGMNLAFLPQDQLVACRCLDLAPTSRLIGADPDITGGVPPAFRGSDQS